MSLTVDGFWKAGFWSTSFWADGFWYEGAPVIPPTPTNLPIEGAGSGKYKWSQDELNLYTDALGSGFTKKALTALENAPKEVKKEVKALVKPYLEEKQVNYERFEQDLTKFTALMQLYEAEMIRRQAEIAADDEEFMMMMN
jgi:hypothetical protein